MRPVQMAARVLCQVIELATHGDAALYGKVYLVWVVVSRLGSRHWLVSVCFGHHWAG